MKILIAGGAGFIGSTIASACDDSGVRTVVLDNLVTGRREYTRDRAFYEGDIADGDLIDRIFAEHPDIHAVIDCAALIVVPDSVADPLGYYRENVAKGIQFIDHLVRNGCPRLLFSSSASIYRADPGDFSVDETSAIEALSPYARTKAIFETILRDIAASGALKVISLRYFNPIGADPQLRTGLQIRKPTHALGKMIDVHNAGEQFTITGTNWPTRDGSGIRDYVHVWDLARAHVNAVRRFDDVTDPDPYRVINLGTGDGTTVRELIAAFEGVIGQKLSCVETGPRPGDTAGAYTRSSLAQELLDWKPQLSIEDGIRDSLRWYAKRDTVIDTD
ncbi:UDP-glucose 4-epimerase GalE [Streptacidiphilus sp. P02-A3a]|uniref:UDP-glucose 4-epimerase GalE n=1 Tax=Streptacidiphilus sp. P02-A3a TaxID=2704468 RepID=UPI0015FA954D|nr:UDP-glucose 4-epimerase GalE [Streptacidiphilus sp. P02-A3a]QMU72035.1 UDP-glucose 4-epimerase GalE [Streptacidiphilus sp. P02-A3a]